MDCSFDQLRSCFGQWRISTDLKNWFLSWLQSNVATKEDQRMGWVETGLKDHLVPNPLPWAGMPPTGAGCSKPIPT